MKPLDSIKLAASLKQTTYFISSFIGDDPFDTESCIGMGSGVAINQNGYLLTAAHVVTGRLPLTNDDIHDENVKIIAKTENGNFEQYVAHAFIPNFNNPKITKTISIDLAIIRPINPQMNIPFIPISQNPIILGENILMAGYPDDMTLPFELDKVIDSKAEENLPIIRQFSEKKKAILMIKSGIIGHVRNITLFDRKQSVQITHFFIDNQLHNGASGGPVLDHFGNVIGIINQRAITSVSHQNHPNLNIPSGSTIAVSASTILPYI